MIAEPIRSAVYPTGAARVEGGTTRMNEQPQQSFRVEPVRSTSHPRERRSSEARENAAALHLGVAAQMLIGQSAPISGPGVLPSHPAMRTAARYATTAEGAAPLGTLGFSRLA